MERNNILQMGLQPGDWVYTELKSHTLKIGRFLGFQPMLSRPQTRYCIEVNEGRLLEWLNESYIKTIEVVQKAAGFTPAHVSKTPPTSELLRSIDEQLQSAGLSIGDRAFIEYTNYVVRSGIFLGLHPSPLNSDWYGLCLTYDEEENIITWISLELINHFDLTIPKHLIEEVDQQLAQDRSPYRVAQSLAALAMAQDGSASSLQ